MATLLIDRASPFAVRDARPLDPRQVPRSAAHRREASRARTSRCGRLETLWINTGTLCNLACKTCYIESSPTNDALVYLTLAEVDAYLDEAASARHARDRLHRRRAVHEPRHAGDAALGACRAASRCWC